MPNGKHRTEPAKSFTFTVSRVPNSPGQFNLTCQASQVFPRPSLTLFRYRAGPPGELQQQQRQQQLGRQHQAAGSQVQSGRRQQQTGRPRLAAASLRQEPIADTKTHLTLSYGRAGSLSAATSQAASKFELENDANEINHFSSMQDLGSTELRPSSYEISSWALVDEASLSSYVVTQFECLLSIDGLDQLREPHLQPRLSLALQKGKFASRAALKLFSVGLFTSHKSSRPLMSLPILN